VKGNNAIPTFQHSSENRSILKVYSYVIAKEFQSIRLHPAMVERTVRAMIGQLCSICPTGTWKTMGMSDCNVSLLTEFRGIQSQLGIPFALQGALIGGVPHSSAGEVTPLHLPKTFGEESDTEANLVPIAAW